MGFFSSLFGKKQEEEKAPKKYEGNFFNIARNGTLDEVKEALKEGANVNEKNDEWCTPLMFAAEENSDPMVIKTLIDAGAILESKTKGGATPIMGAVQKNPNIEVLKMLLKEGANVNKENEIGFTPLIYAAIYNSNPDFITVLIEAGADINYTNKIGYNAFLYAVLNNSIEIVKRLVSHGSYILQRDVNGLNALDHLKKQNTPQDSELYKYISKIFSDA